MLCTHTLTNYGILCTHRKERNDAIAATWMDLAIILLNEVWLLIIQCNLKENEIRQNSLEQLLQVKEREIVNSIQIVEKKKKKMKSLEKVLIFIVKLISEIKGYTNEQKEILVRYYQELLLNYQIITEEDLFNVHFNFLRLVHKDNTLNFIEHLIFGTILINTKKEIITNAIQEFLNMVTIVCLHNELSYSDMDKKKLMNFYKFIKQICLVLQNKEDDDEEENKKEKKENNGKEEDDLDTKIKICYSTIETFFNKINKKYSNLIKKDEDLNKKFKKLKQTIKDCINS